MRSRPATILIENYVAKSKFSRQVERIVLRDARLEIAQGQARGQMTIDQHLIFIDGADDGEAFCERYGVVLVAEHAQAHAEMATVGIDTIGPILERRGLGGHSVHGSKSGTDIAVDRLRR